MSGEIILPYPEKITAIKEMTHPNNQTELTSFLGIVNYLSKFRGRLAEIEMLLRELQKKTSEWYGRERRRIVLKK